MRSKKSPRAPTPGVIYLIRHGQYLSDSDEGHLTSVGLKQANLVARHLKRFPIGAVVSSDIPRALQTAAVIAKTLRLPTPTKKVDLREIVPSAVPGMRVPLAKRAEGSAQLDRLLARLARQTRTHEVVVCHGNLIRSVVCRLLGHTLGKFRFMTVHHASITRLHRTDNGLRLITLNEIEHLPHALQTLS